MFLLDTNGGVGAAERMESGSGSGGTPPQKKTVYRISLTLVKRESLDEEPPRQLRREGSVELQRGGAGGGGLLEQLQEVEDESDERSLAAASRGHMRNFRTFSTGQLELGRLKVSRKLLLLQEKKVEGGGGGEGEKEDTPPTVPAVQNGGVTKRRFLKAKSVEEATSDPEPKVTHSKSNGKAAAAPAETETPPPKRSAGLLRRSFSFRHWSSGGGELLRLRALAKDRHHSSSGCIGALQDTKAAAPQAPPSPLVPVAAPTPAAAVATPTRQKSRTLETGAVLRKTDSLSELSRKTRTLDNSDLQRLGGGGAGGGGGAFLLRGGGGRSSERRLVRFFSGIFSSRGGGAPAPGSPGPEQRPLQRGTRRVLSQSSCESVDGGGTQGKATPTTKTTPP